MSFSDLGLSEEALRAVADAGYHQPTPIQSQAIPIVLQGRDVLGTAQTGTGKTASFTLPMIDILAAGQAKARMPRSLILEPTRELAAQVQENFKIYGKYHKLSVALLIGGVRMEEQERLIDRGVDVLIATPGRLLDHAQHGGLLLGGLKILVIDEADRMLDMGFIPDVEKIARLAPPIRQTMLFSATMPKEIRRLADNFLHNPREISVSPPASPAETVDQALVYVDVREKRAALSAFLRQHEVPSALVFCNRKRDIGVLARALRKDGFSAEELHGDMSQPARTATLAKFRDGGFSLMVCSDVAARGLDIQGLPYVFLYDVPSHAEDYVHRIGRTGRAGMVGRAVTLATREDAKYVAAIEELIGKTIPLGELPGFEQAEPDKSAALKGRRGRRRTPRVAHETAPEQETSGADPARGRRRSRRGGARKGKPDESPVSSAPAQPDQRAAAERPRARSSDKGGRRERDEGAGDMIGMGEDVPAFLLAGLPEEEKKKVRRRKKG